METTLYSSTREEQPVMRHTAEDVRQGLGVGRPFLTWVIKLKVVLEAIQATTPRPLTVMIRNNRMEIRRDQSAGVGAAFWSIDFSHGTYLLVLFSVSPDSPARLN